MTKKNEPEAKFFYTTNHPHQWSSGPVFHYWGNAGVINSIEEAKELAEKAFVGGYSESRCDTTYGCIVECRVDDK